MSILGFWVIIVFFIFITGLCIGSFLNVVILRAFSNESIAYPASKCPICQKPLKWYHNIPVISYLCLSGKCAYCKEGISLQYPIVELITAFLFVAVFFKFATELSLFAMLNTLFMLAFAALFVVLAVTDIREKVVFDFHTYTLIILGLIYNLFNIGHLYEGQKLLALGHFSLHINNSIIAAVLGLVGGIVIMEALARFGYLVAGTRAFGEGDTYIAAGLGAIFGWKYLLTILVYSFVIQIALTIPVFVKKLFLQKDYRTLVSFTIFFFFVIAFKYMSKTPLAENLAIFGIMTIILLSLGIYVCKRILGGIRNQENLTYLPFGPAMVFAAFIIMFTL